MYSFDIFCIFILKVMEWILGSKRRLQERITANLDLIR